MILKRKSLIVALVSGFVVSLVLVLTLVGYAGYLEIKHERFKRGYQHLLRETMEHGASLRLKKVLEFQENDRT